jgi:hypothetical protein
MKKSSQQFVAYAFYVSSGAQKSRGSSLSVDLNDYASTAVTISCVAYGPADPIALQQLLLTWASTLVLLQSAFLLKLSWFV